LEKIGLKNMSKMTPKQKEMHFRLSYNYWMDWRTKPEEGNISELKNSYEKERIVQDDLGNSP